MYKSMKHNVDDLSVDFDKALADKKVAYHRLSESRQHMVDWLENMERGECTESHPRFIETRNKFLCAQAEYGRAKRRYLHIKNQIKNCLFSIWCDEQIRLRNQQENMNLQYEKELVSRYLNSYKNEKSETKQELHCRRKRLFEVAKEMTKNTCCSDQFGLRWK